MSPDTSAERLGSKLFLSCDLVGSTGHKQAAARPRTWLPDFLSFYYDFPALVRSHLGDGLSARLVFWKAVGDELLYVADVDHEKHIDKIVKAWLRAMDDYEKRLVERNRKIADEGEVWSSESADAAIVNKMKLKGGRPGHRAPNALRARAAQAGEGHDAA